MKSVVLFRGISVLELFSRHTLQGITTEHFESSWLSKCCIVCFILSEDGRSLIRMSGVSHGKPLSKVMWCTFVRCG